MRRYYQWTVKNLWLKKKIVSEYKYEAVKQVGNAILNGEFTFELQKKEVRDI